MPGLRESVLCGVALPFQVPVPPLRGRLPQQQPLWADAASSEAFAQVLQSTVHQGVAGDQQFRRRESPVGGARLAVDAGT